MKTMPAKVNRRAQKANLKMRLNQLTFLRGFLILGSGFGSGTSATGITCFGFGFGLGFTGLCLCLRWRSSLG